MTTPSRHADLEQQSIRASCDRCRSKKLGCVVSAARTGASALQCVRCLRAKVCCVFGRRAQNTRRNSSVKASSSSLTTGIERKANQPLAAKAAGSTRQQPITPRDPVASAKVPLSPPPALDEPLGEASAASPLSDPGVWYDGFVLSSLRNPSSTTDADPSLDHDCFMDPCPALELQGESDLGTLLAASETWTSWLPLSLPEALDGQVSVGDSSVPSAADSPLEPCTLKQQGTPAYAVKDLSGLVTDIHRTINLLTTSDQCAAGQDLGKCPVGQASGAIPATSNPAESEPVSFTSALATSPLETHGHKAFFSRGVSPSSAAPRGSSRHQSVAASSPPPSGPDTTTLPIMLLVLSCYVSLAKLYAAVFVQLQGFVPRSSAVAHGRLQLAGLGPPTGDEAACSRLYVAVQMMLDEFQAAEDVLCACGGAADPSGDEADSTPAWFASQLQTVRLMLRQESAAAGRLEQR
ncbi:hypothetical protein RB597_003178 [Gaeumannomyces tritici]